MAEVKPPDSFESAVAQMTEIVQRAQVATTGEVKSQLDAHTEMLNVKMSGIEKLSEESIRLFKEQNRATALQPLSGKQIELESKLHTNPQIDEILRTVDAQGPYKDVQDTFDAIQIAETLRHGNFLASGNAGAPGVVRAQKATDRLKGIFKERVERAGLKGLDTADIGGGINTGMSASLMTRFLMELQLNGKFPMFDHPNGIGDFKWPVMSTGTVGYIVSETTADLDTTLTSTVRPSQPLLANVTFSPKVLGARTDISRELTEDAIFTIIPTVQQDLALSLALAAEYATNSGDTSTTHQDKDVTLSYDARKAWIGLRFKGLAASGNKTDFGTVAFDETQLGIALKKSGKWLVNRTRDAVMSVSASVWWQMLTNFPSLKYFNLWGSMNTTMQTGIVPAIFGIPIVPSEDWRSLNTVGVVDTTAANNTKTGFVAVRTDQFKIGIKRGVLLEAQYRPEFQAIMLIGTTRLDFKEMRASATYPFVQYGYDITE